MFEFDDGQSEQQQAYETAKTIATFYKVLVQAGMQPSDATRFTEKYFFPELVLGFEMGDDIFNGGLF